MLKLAEYVWLDGATPTQRPRAKTKVIDSNTVDPTRPESFPEWGYDGSSTYQASGSDSDLTLRPVRVIADPIRKDGNFVVMCEVFTPNDKPHATNTRAELRRVLEAGAAKLEPWFGIEQEYTLFKGRSPLGWPDGGYPAPQGPFYCGVGAEEAFGRPFVEAHMKACLEAGIMFYGINAEVMPGQWEFQIGYRGVDTESADPLAVADHLWLARWLMFRVGEDFGIYPTLDCKPVKGDWNGAGAHTNFSTNEMRNTKTGAAAMETAIARLRDNHAAHIAVYGDGLADRLTGHHETCSINEFRSGVADRGASIRIPRHVSKQGGGYLEDRRPGANADPYQVCARILKTICGIG